MSKSVLEQEVTPEFVAQTMREVGKEIEKELKKEVASLQIKVDAKSLMTLGLDRLGLKKNMTERYWWFAGGFAASTAITFVSSFFQSIVW